MALTVKLMDLTFGAYTNFLAIDHPSIKNSATKKLLKKNSENI